jgi:hypothetical protein
MLTWGIVLFGLGLLAFLDSQFNYGYLFRSANSILFMLVSLGVLIRTRILAKQGKKEQLLRAAQELKGQVDTLKDSQKPAEKKQKEEVYA